MRMAFTPKISLYYFCPSQNVITECNCLLKGKYDIVLLCHTTGIRKYASTLGKLRKHGIQCKALND